MVLNALDGGGGYLPADQESTAAKAAASANTKSADSFTLQKSGLNVVVNKVYPFSFAYLYDNPENPSEPIVGPRSPNFLITLQTPDLTQPVTNLVVTPGLLSYGVKWDLIDKALPANKWLIDIQIYESLTGAFAGEEYLVWNGNGNSATILVSNTANRWIRVDTRDQDYRKKSVTYGPFKATDPIVVDTTGPANVTSVSAESGIDTSGYLGFNAYASISWPAVTGGGIRGYRIRFTNDNGSTYSYVDSPGTGTTYKLTGLAIGSTYQIAVATYDEYNNTSSSYVSGPNVTVTGTPSVSNFITGGPFQFGVGVGGVNTNKGLYFDASNYWYVNATNSARLKVGGATSNYLLWDGSTFAIDGNITARGGTFSGNIFMSTIGASIYSGTIDSATGNLTGNGFALNSTGLKVANGTKSVTISAATGTITANGGSIGGWSITDTTLSKNNIILDSSGVIQVGSTAANSVYLQTASSGGTSFVMWAGNNTPDANAKFRVAADGTLYAQNAVLGSGTILSGYATTTALAATDTKATNAASTATAAASTATAASSTATAAKTTADAALPAVNFSKSEVIKKINASTNGTWINGGVLEAGTVIADNVVSTYVYAGYINADKINAGTIGASVSITTPNITVGAEGSSYFFKTNHIRTGTSIAALGINAINMISQGSAGTVSSWYPYYNNDVAIGVVSPNTLRYTTTYLVNNPNVSSDFRLKEDIQETPLGLQFIKDLRPIKFKWKERNKEGDAGVRDHYGFIAQEVKQVLDSHGVYDTAALWAVDRLDDEDAHQALIYNEFISPMTKAIQELSDMVESLQQEVNTLKGI